MPVHYLYGDALAAPPHHALIYCVGQDFAGAVTRRYGGREELQRQQLRIGDVGIFRRGHRVILAMVTKARSCDKPDQADVSRSLERALDLCLQLNVHVLSGPLIGAGLDELPLQFVQREVLRVFAGSPISVTLWSQPPSLCRSTVLAGDSNFLRVLGVRGERGCVRSGARMEWVIRKLRGAPPAGRVDIMVGTNDILDATKKRLTGNAARQHARLQLLKLRKVARRLHGPVRFLTVPPLPHLRQDAAMTPAKFNGMLLEIMGPFFEVVDLHGALQQSSTIGGDGVHLNRRGVNIVLSLL